MISEASLMLRCRMFTSTSTQLWCYTIECSPALAQGLRYKMFACTCTCKYRECWVALSHVLDGTLQAIQVHLHANLMLPFTCTFLHTELMLCYRLFKNNAARDVTGCLLAPAPPKRIFSCSFFCTQRTQRTVRTVPSAPYPAHHTQRTQRTQHTHRTQRTLSPYLEHPAHPAQRTQRSQCPMEFEVMDYRTGIFVCPSWYGMTIDDLHGLDDTRDTHGPMVDFGSCDDSGVL